MLTSLPKPQALMDTARAIAAAKLKRQGDRRNEHLHHFRQGKGAKRVLRKAGHIMLDTPGQRHRLAGARTAIWCSMPAATARRSRSSSRCSRAFGRHVYDVGAFGNGSKMKYVANLLVAINNVATAEAMVLGMKAGLTRR